MKLLDAETIEKQVDQSVEEKHQRVRKLHDEETAIVKRLAAAHDNEVKELAEIDQGLIAARANQKQEKARLRTEVLNLEERRRRALEPILEKEQEIIQAQVALVAAEEVLEDREARTEQAFADHRKARDEYEERRKAYDEKDLDLREREAKLLEEWSDLERNHRAKMSKARDEWARLRAYFEAEDDKIKAQAKALKR